MLRVISIISSVEKHTCLQKRKRISTIYACPIELQRYMLTALEESLAQRTRSQILCLLVWKAASCQKQWANGLAIESQSGRVKRIGSNIKKTCIYHIVKMVSNCARKGNTMARQGGRRGREKVWKGGHATPPTDNRMVETMGNLDAWTGGWWTMHRLVSRWSVGRINASP